VVNWIIWTLILSSLASLHHSRRVTSSSNYSATMNAQEVQEGTGVGNGNAAGPTTGK